MTRVVSSALALNLILVLAFDSGSAHAQLPASANESNPTREFIMSCTYGVLAGTLVGAASLAFTDKPGENLKTVARGASLGLYTGIMLGLYVIYIVPSMEEEPEDPVARLERLPFVVSLTFDRDDQPDGLKADWTLLRF